MLAFALSVFASLNCNYIYVGLTPLKLCSYFPGVSPEVAMSHRSFDADSLKQMLGIEASRSPCEVG